MFHYNKNLVKTARELRKNMTPEEKKIWYGFLKRLPLTVHRQHNIENYIVDFYITAKKTVIEIDGIQHGMTENREKDRQRDEELSKLGICVLRYTNESIQNNFNDVAESILKNIGFSFEDLKPLKSKQTNK